MKYNKKVELIRKISILVYYDNFILEKTIMGIIELILTSIGLGMDAFAVSV